jgi:ribosomal protein S18 acetylase RimI-like enzyme
VKYIVRKANISDVQSVFELLRARMQESDKDFPETRKSYKLWLPIFELMVAKTNILIFVALDQKEVVGILTCYLLPRLELGNYFAVVEDVNVALIHRRKGVGKSLFTHLFEYLKSRQIKHCHLATEKANIEAIEFYNSLGFLAREEGFSKEIY